MKTLNQLTEPNELHQWLLKEGWLVTNQIQQNKKYTICYADYTYTHKSWESNTFVSYKLAILLTLMYKMEKLENG